MTKNSKSYRQKVGWSGSAICGILLRTIPLFCLPVAPAVSAELVTNPSFESGKEGWERAKTVFSIEHGEGFNGTHGLVYRNKSKDAYCFPFQKLKLNLGERYLVTGRIRTKDIQGSDIGAGICVEWNNAAGSWMGGSYSKGLKGTSDGWVRVAFTADVPTSVNIAQTLVSPFVRRGMTGDAWFDDISVTPLKRDILDDFVCSAYRNCAESGYVTFLATLNLENPHLYSGEFSFESASGTRKKLRPDSLAADHARVRIAVGDFPVGESVVEFTLFDAEGAKVVCGTCSFRRILPGADKRRVRFDAFGRTLVDGKPFFPLGISIDRVTEKRLAHLKEASLNCVGFSEGRKATRAELDLCAKYGFMVRDNLTGFFSGVGRAESAKYRTMGEADAALAAHVNEFKCHPAILAWELHDELGPYLADVLKKRREFMEKLDADHPTYSVICQVEDMRRYMGSVEAVGSDPYPIGSVARHPMSQPTVWTRMTKDGTFGMRPMWQIPQIFDWAVHRKEVTPDMRAPTFEEMRSMAWQCIAGGSNGLMFYSYHSILWADARGRAPFSERWKDVCRMTREIAAHIPGLLSDEPSPVVGKVTGGLAARTWTVKGVSWLLLVNPHRESRTGTISVGGKHIVATLEPLDVVISKVSEFTKRSM